MPGRGKLSTEWRKKSALYLASMIIPAALMARGIQMGINNSSVYLIIISSLGILCTLLLSTLFFLGAIGWYKKK
ncbi:hypothetical protein SAMN04487820_10213 [Actinopolyspora mzabensis]|uniref:Uncharacterized protein n=1 Tax=Actinopolyspora mzabensis TaxID=995066 RepID=A0A1G8WHW0_ACTMZ|nr:hypothetical protein SAMN04487820_10213 [Actinopolyspora mzabensis]